MFVNITEDEKGQPFEVFLNLGKAGGSAMADAEAMGRLISLALRSGIPLTRSAPAAARHQLGSRGGLRREQGALASPTRSVSRSRSGRVTSRECSRICSLRRHRRRACQPPSRCTCTARRTSRARWLSKCTIAATASCRRVPTADRSSKWQRAVRSVTCADSRNAVDPNRDSVVAMNCTTGPESFRPRRQFQSSVSPIARSQSPLAFPSSVDRASEERGCWATDQSLSGMVHERTG